MSAFDKQESGSHYRNLNPQPAKVLHSWGVGHIEGEIIYHLIRWRHKDGLQDLRKVVHWAQLLLELEESKQAEEREKVMHSGTRFHEG